MAHIKPQEEGGVLMKVTTEVSVSIFNQRLVEVKTGATVLLPDTSDTKLRKVMPWVVTDGGFDNQGRVILGLTRQFDNTQMDVVGERDEMVTILEKKVR